MATQFEQLVLQYQEYLHSLAFKLTGDSVAADDLFQDTMLKIISNEEKFNLQTSFKAWSQTILRNTFINQYRQKITRQTDSCDTTDISFLRTYRQSTHNDGDSVLTTEFLYNIIETLDDTHKKVFLLYFRGYKYDEMADLLGKSIPQVRNIVFSARKMLQYKLRGYHSDLVAN